MLLRTLSGDQREEEPFMEMESLPVLRTTKKYVFCLKGDRR